MHNPRAWFVLSLLLCAALLMWQPASRAMQAPEPALRAGANINMAGGPVYVETDPVTGDVSGLIEGDPYLTKQNELSIAVSSRNRRHLVAGANDYRAVQLPFVDAPPAPGAAASGDVWGGFYVSVDEGAHWRSTLLPCYPQDTRPECAASPLFGFEAMADPQVRAGSNGMIYYCGIVFDRGENADGGVFCTRFMDLNNVEGVDFPLSLPNPPDPDQPYASPIQRIDDVMIQFGTAGQFLDKIYAITGPPGQGAKSETISVPLNCDPTSNAACLEADGADGTVDGFITQTIPCGPVYVAYADFTGGLNNPNSKLLVARSLTCGRTWENATVVNQTQGVSQGATLGIGPDGRVSVAWRTFGLDSELDAIWIAHQDTKSKNKFKFEEAIKVHDLESADPTFTEPMDLPTRAAELTDDTGAVVDDPYTGPRVNTYPTLAIDGGGRHYLAWSQRGWGADVDLDGLVNDGARIVMTTSMDGETWSSPTGVDPQLPAPGDPGVPSIDPTLTAPQGHQIMPHLTVFEGRLGMVFYDYRDDVFPGILRRLVSPACNDEDGDGDIDFVDCCRSEVGNGAGADSSITLADCDRLDDPEFLESLIPADPANFAPLSLRHTVDTFYAEALPGDSPSFTVTKASRYPKVLVPKLDEDGNPVLLPGGGPDFDLVQIAYHATGYPLYGGDKAFIGDYFELASSHIVPTDGGWGRNLDPQPCNPAVVDCKPSPIAHVAFSDTRDVQPPEPTIENIDGQEVLLQDWAGEYVGIAGRERMLDQNPYTARMTGGVVLGSAGNFKPMFDEPADPDKARAYALILENTLNEGILQPGNWIASSRFYRLSFSTPNGIEASFTPDFLTSTLDVEVNSVSAVAVTLFARRIAGNNLTPRITVWANEIDAIGAAGFKAGGLQASTVLNPDPSNPLPVNVDPDNPLNDILTEETHTPAFVPFNCQALVDADGDGIVDPLLGDPTADLLDVFPDCAPDAMGNFPTEVLALRTYWPDLADPARPFAINASLFNASLFNASLFNPAIYTASLFNPALLDQDVYNWANASLFNASLFNASLFNASLFNASLFNASLFNPAIADAIRNASLFNASLFNASLFNASLFNASLFNASLFNASLFNASLFNASLFNASLFNASLFNASLFNDPVNGPIDGAGGVAGGGVSPSDQVYNTALFGNSVKNGAKIIDVTFQITADVNTPTGYFFWPLFQNLGPNSQLLIRRVFPTNRLARDPDCLATSPTPETCGLKTFQALDQEILANIRNLPDFQNVDAQVLNQLLLQATFQAPPGGEVYATLRVVCTPSGENPLVCTDGYDPSAVSAVVVPQATMDGLAGTWTSLEEPGTVTFGYTDAIDLTAKVGSYNGTVPTGSVEFFAGQTLLGSAPLVNIGGEARAQLISQAVSAADVGLNVADSPFTVVARYVPSGDFECGIGTGGDGSGCVSQPIELLVTPVDVAADDVDLGVVELGLCDTNAFDGVDTITTTFDGSPIDVCAQSATDAGGQPVLPATVSFEVSYQDEFGNELPGPPTGAGTYTVVITVSDTDGNFTGQITVQLIIKKGSATLILGNLAQTFDGTPRVVTATTAPAGLISVAITYDGLTEAPVNAGSYAIVASLTNDNWDAEDATGTLVVAKAAATMALSDLAQTFDGTPREVTVTTTPAGLETVTITYDGSATAPTNAGSYAVVASLANDNYEAPDANDTLVVAKAAASFNIEGLAQEYDGTAREVTVATVPAGLDGVSVTYDGAAEAPTEAGSYTVVVSLTNDNYAADDVTETLVVGKAPASLELGALSQTFDGSPRTVTVTTTPAGLGGLSVTYDGSATPPTAAGSYAVVASLDNPNYSAPDVSGTLVVAKAAATLSLSGLAATFDGSPKPVTVTTNPAGLSGVTVTYDSSPAAPTNAGSYAVVATLSNANYEAADVTGTLVIAKALAILQISGLNVTYDGTPQPVTVTTNPAGLGVVSVSYDGSPAAPTDAGSYAVVATLANANWQAVDATGTLVIAKAAQSISFGPLPDRNVTDSPFVVAATATSGLPVSFTVSGPATIAGDVVTLNGTGAVTVTASQAGNVNFEAAPDVQQSFNVTFIDFVGFGPPVGAAGDLSDPASIPFAGSYGQNKTLTLKWELFQAGVEVSDLDLIHSIAIADAAEVGNSCQFVPVVNPIDLYPTCNDTNACAGGTELRVADQFVFNWKLNFVTPGCYTVILRLGSASGDIVYQSKVVMTRVRP